MPIDLHGARLARMVPIAGVVVVLAGSAPAAAASAVDVVPVLTSTPFGAGPGQSIKHTITLSATGTGPVAGVRVEFRTTAGLDRVQVGVGAGTCPTVTAQTVICELGIVDFSKAAAPEVTITGTVHSGTAPGALVQNLVTVTSQQPDANPDNNVVSNAYLIPGGTLTPAREPTSDPTAAAQPSGTAQTTRRLTPVIVVLVLGALAAGIFIQYRRRNR